MKLLLLYIIQAAVIQVLIYIFYRYYLSNQSYTHWNRFFLISSAVLSLIWPFISVHFPMFDSVINAGNFQSVDYCPISTNELMVLAEVPEVKSNNSFFSSLSLHSILFSIYFSGLIVVAVKTVLSLIRLRRDIRDANEVYFKGLKILLTDKKVPVCSFFNTILMNKEKFYSKQSEIEQIIAHETAHIKGNHTSDKLFFEILKAIFWFNPAIYKLQTALSEIHEYIADSCVVTFYPRKTYASLLLHSAEKQSDNKIVNNFSLQLLKLRIHSLYNPESKRLQKIKFLLTVPVAFAGLFIITSAKSFIPGLALIKNEFVMPVNSTYEIALPFMKSKPVTSDLVPVMSQKDQSKYVISHYFTAFTLPSFSDVLVVKEGTIKSIKTINNWGITEYEIVVQHDDGFESFYKGLYAAVVKKGYHVNAGSKIAITGDNRLYPGFSVQLRLDDEPVDLFNYVK